jgi:hypothetical protein
MLSPATTYRGVEYTVIGPSPALELAIYDWRKR